MGGVIALPYLWLLDIDGCGALLAARGLASQGLAWGIRLGARRRLGASPIWLQCAVGYGQRQQGTGVTGQSEHTLGLDAGIIWHAF